jgi:hydroxymethylpyrimidine/phosphomethylpyrimidine kinase
MTGIWSFVRPRAKLAAVRTGSTTVLPCALAISGLDPSGGAGLIADVRAFEAAGVWACGVVAMSTVQSTAGLRRSWVTPSRDLSAQLREVYARQNIRSIKIGALGSTDNARAVLRWIRTISPAVPVVLDPVMRPTAGARRARLLEDRGIDALRALAARVTLVTPNVPEAEVLTGMAIRSLDDARAAARALVGAGARAALVKGGHLPAHPRAAKTVDVLAVGPRLLRLAAERVPFAVHGTGCALASLAAGRLAARDGAALTDEQLADAVRWAKRRLARAISRPARIGDGLLVLPLRPQAR